METVTNNSCKYSHITDVGAVRELNEDSLYYSDNLWIVADGMGGHACGEVASRIAIEEIADHYQSTGLLDDAIQLAHHKIIDTSQQNITQSGMGTTVVALANTEQGFEIAWVGDSRAYLWEIKKQRLTQLTEDHSLIVRLIKSNLISAEDAKTHPQRHMITQCLGSLEVAQLQVDNYQGQWKYNQQILLCSDGLTDELSKQEIADIMKQDITVQSKMSTLVEAAKQAGSKDNISIIIIDSPLAEPAGFWDKVKSLF